MIAHLISSFGKENVKLIAPDLIIFLNPSSFKADFGPKSF